MRHQALLILSLFLSLASAPAQQNDSAPVSCTQLIAWSAGGVSSQRLNRLTHEQGIAFRLDAAASDSLRMAGVDPVLIQHLRTLIPVSIDTGAAGCPAPLARAAELIQQKQYQEAQSILRKLIASDPGNAALHFAAAYAYQRQEDWDCLLYTSDAADE